MTLAQERAAIAAGMAASRAPTSEASRRAAGQRIESERQGDGGAARRAIGTNNAAERRGEQVVEDLHRLQPAPQRQAKPLPAVPVRGGVPAKQGTAEYKAPAQGSSGIASPLTEKTKTESAQTVPDRDYHPLTNFTTSDGLLVFSYRPTSVLRLTDADGNPVVINLARPKSAS